MPSNFQAENLVQLTLAYSSIKQLWTGVQNLVSLKEINLSHSEQLATFPDLSRAKYLETVNVDFCSSLEEVPLSIRFLDKLTDLNMRYCTSLLRLPSRIKLRSLKTLNLSGCSKLREFPQLAENITYLNLSETAIDELPESFGNFRRLIALNLKDCKQLGDLPESICLLKSLVTIDLSGCSKITRFPDISGDVQFLYLSETAIEEIPSSIGLLPRLTCLDLMNCNRLKNLPSLFKLASLEKLILSGCSSITEFPHVSWDIKKLFLDGTAIEEIPSSIKYFPELVELSLQNCKRFLRLPRTIWKFKLLQKLNLSGCSTFVSFPEILEVMGSLKYLYLDGTGISNLPSPMRNLPGLLSLELRSCKNLYGLQEVISGRVVKSPATVGGIQYLRKLNLSGCCLLEVPYCIDCLPSLESLDLSRNLFEEIPVSINKLFELQYLGLRDCKKLISLPDLPPRLTKLDAHKCCSLKSASLDPTGIEGNNFEFFFTNCHSLDLDERRKIIAYALTKFQVYSERLHHQMSYLLAGESSLWIPSWVRRFHHKGASTTVQLPSNWADSDFLGFELVTSIAVDCRICKCNGDHDFQVKCRYHFKNEYIYDGGDDLYCYYGGWYGRRFLNGEHTLVGYDPCVNVTKEDRFGNYSEVVIEFYPVEMNDHPLECIRVRACEVHLLYTPGHERSSRVYWWDDDYCCVPNSYLHQLYTFTGQNRFRMLPPLFSQKSS